MATCALASFHQSSNDTTTNPSWEIIFGFWPKRGDTAVLPLITDPEPKKAKLESTVKELQVEAAKWKTEYTEAEHRAYYRYGREGVAQWEEPEILVELRRCAKLASGGEV